MKTSSSNRRQHTRLRINRAIAVPIQIFPVLPFLGESVSATLLNISAGGMALMAHFGDSRGTIPKGTKLKVHFRLPGQPLCECVSLVTHNIKMKEEGTFIGLKFLKAPSYLLEAIDNMCRDNLRCDEQIRQMAHPLCDISCTFYSLCHKPLRRSDIPFEKNGLEIAFQQTD